MSPVRVNGAEVSVLSGNRIDASRVSPLVDALRNVGTAPTMWLRLNDLADPPVTNEYDAAILADPSTVAYWPLSETAGTSAANAVSGGAHTGTIFGNPSLGAALPHIGSSDAVPDWDGSGDYMRAAYAAALNPAAFTYSVWIYRDVDTGASEYLADCTSATLGFHCYISSADKLAMGVKNGGATATVAGATSVPTGRWVHAVFVNDGTTSSIYMDGRLDGSGAAAYGANTSVNLHLFSSSVPSLYFSGKGGKSSLHNEAKTAAEIAALFVLGRPVIDAMGNHQGGMIGSPVSAAGAISGDSDACFDFNGTTDAIVVPYHADLNAATFSVGGLITRDADSGAVENIIDSRVSTNVGWRVFVDASDKLNVGIGTGAAQVFATSTTSVPADGTPVHYVGTYDGTNIRLYYNGSLEHTSANGTMSANTSAPTYIARGFGSGTANLWNGKIDEPIYHGGVVLSAAQIAAIAAASAPTGRRITVR